MSDRLPERLDPIRLADQGAELAGQVAFSTMKRLAASLHSTEGAAQVQLTLGVDPQWRVRYLRGRIRAELDLVCQRCLNPMRLSVDLAVSLGLVESEAEGERLPEQYDPLIVERGLMELSEVIEDELILALPIVALHAGQCTDRLPTEAGLGAAGGGAERPSPFAVLDKLKRK
jgi:uncharacterized protein